ncbi:hypothetical protein Efla_006444 [Eimeria flavescens]
MPSVSYGYKGTAGRDPGAKSEDSCSPCEAGTLCQIQLGVLVQVPCPPGFYCPEASHVGVRCPEGTVGAFSGAASSDDCSSCPAGYFCSGTGLSSTSGLCNAGYICLGGSITPTPTDGTTGFACDFGGYCPAGATKKAPCLPGTYNPNKIGRDASDCIACPAGRYCEGDTSTEPTGLCAAGFICTGGASNPRQKLAPKGHFAAEGAGAATLCPAGTYNPNEGQEHCRACDAGFYCPDTGLTTITQCPAGYYCEEGSIEPTPCPEGTLNSRTMQPSLESCRPCPPGFYCSGKGNQVVSGTCDEGFFCATGSATPRPEANPQGTLGPCPKGAYCERGQERPHLCPPGTYGSTEQLTAEYECTRCTEGMYCSRTGLTQPEGPCARGYVCPAGSVTPYEIACRQGTYCLAGATFEIPCPAGTYSSTPGSPTCQKCPAGYSCSIGTADYSSAPCPKGSFCSQESTFELPVPCPAGTFGPFEGLKHQRQCQPCLPGKMCVNKGGDKADAPCSEGFYCSGQMKAAHEASTPVICSAGSYCPEEAVYPITCPPGKLCTRSGLTEPDADCPAGYLCPAGSSSLKSASRCPVGFVCDEGAVDAKLCPRGSIGTNSGLGSEVQCWLCVGGMYCDSTTPAVVTGACNAGFYCPEGSTSPWMEICPKGSACPPGSSAPIPCPVGFSTATPGSSECTKCAAGINCDGVDPEHCREGFYCEEGKASQPCPAGTYMPFKGSTSRQSCLPCPGGYACPKAATATPSPCEAGYFCIRQSTATAPLILASLSEALQAAAGIAGAATEGAMMCPEGTFCPRSSRFAIPCPPGMFCGRSALKEPEGLCAAGHFCVNAAVTDSPQGGEDVCPSTTAGGFCPVGHYCPQGSSVPHPCPAGTLRPYRLGQELKSCQACPAGKFCQSTGLTQPSGGCLQGFFCSDGSKASFDATQEICPPGSKCEEGVGQPQECPAGSFQANSGGASCSPCPAGFFCSHPAKEPTACSEGHYCPERTQTPLPCPPGTFRDVEGGTSAEDCFTCPPGMYCSTWGIGGDLPECPGGYYCPLGAGTLGSTASATHTERSTISVGSIFFSRSGLGRDELCTEGIPCIYALPCPGNFYCPEGSWAPLPCPAGTGHTRQGATAPSDCIKCGAGVYCASNGTRMPCDEGFVCYGASLSSRPVDKTTGEMCPTGHFCPTGTSHPRVCPLGTYGPTAGLGSACEPCPAGRLCDEAGLQEIEDIKNIENIEDDVDIPSSPCPKGHYCPQGTLSPRQCPVGTYNDKMGQVHEGACLKCPPGKILTPNAFRQSLRERHSSGPFALNRGSQIKDSSLAYLPTSAISCPAGYVCPEGEIVPEPCPEGTVKTLAGDSECIRCPAGRYCAHTALAVADGDGHCSPGFYCRGGATTATPTDKQTGDICPEHKYCPAGSSTPVDCPPGTYSNSTGVESCPPCTAGFTCKDGAEYECPTGGFCPAGVAAKTPCAPGTLGLTNGTSVQEQCGECPAGKMCSNGDTKEDCQAGLLCLGGAARGSIRESIDYSDQPESFWRGTQIGLVGPCPRGFYCPEGATEPKRCSEGQTTNSSGAEDPSQCVSCPGGTICGQLLSTPLRCPEGHYCPLGAERLIPCPAGTYQNLRGGEGEDQCKPCAAGHVCPIAGMAIYSNSLCPWGSFCIEGSKEPELCPPGTFNDRVATTSAAECKPCPEGFICSHNRAEVLHFKRAPTLFPYFRRSKMRVLPLLQRANGVHRTPCPPKAYCPARSVTPSECPEHFYCPGQSAQPIACPADHYCPKGMEVPIPCPRGYFCPGGSETPFTCPAGTRAKLECDILKAHEDCCESCPPGTYSAADDTAACLPCSAGHVCTGGATTSTPLLPAEGGFICPAGYYCPKAATSPIPCEPGTYRSEPGASDVAECMRCPAGAYQRFPAMASCESCGPNAVEEKAQGSTTCTCLGESRAYQHGDKTCPCQARHVSYDQHMAVAELLDGTLPCQPLTVKRCESEDSRDHLGYCIRSLDCTAACGPEGGSFVSTAGICECAKAPKETAQCDATCQASLPTATLDGHSIKLVDPLTGQISMLEHPDLDLSQAQIICSKLKVLLEDLPIPCNIYFQRVDAEGLHSLYVPPSTLWTPHRSFYGSARKYMVSKKSESRDSLLRGNYLNQWRARVPARLLTAAFSDRKTNRRLMEPWRYQHLSEMQLLVIDNSLLCVTVGSSIVWELQDSAFPVYLEASLLNTNTGMDGTGFRRMKADANEGRLERRFFVHTFETEGTFVFASSLQETRLAIVRALRPGMECRGGTGFPTPIRSRYLSLLAIALDTSSLIWDPNWLLAVGLLFTIMITLLLLLLLAARFVGHRWEAVRAATYRSSVGLPNALALKLQPALALDTQGSPSRVESATQIVHYRIRDDLLDKTEQMLYDAEADVKYAVDRLQVEIDAQDFRATLEKFLDMRVLLHEVLAKDQTRANESCAEAEHLMQQALSTLQERLECTDLEGSLPITSRHIILLLRCILAAFYGPEETEYAAEELLHLEQELQNQQWSREAFIKQGAVREAEILRSCAAKAGPSTFDTVDVLAKGAKESEPFLVNTQDLVDKASQKANGDPEGTRHLLLASVYGLLSKRNAEVLSIIFNRLSSAHREIHVAESRIAEKEAAFSSLCNACRQEATSIQKQQNLRILEWQQTWFVMKFRENKRKARPPACEHSQAIAELLTAREEQVPSIMSSLIGTVTAILQQNRSTTQVRRGFSPAAVKAGQELQDIRQLQEAQIESVAESHRTLYLNSLQALLESQRKHCTVLSHREKAALARLGKASRKEIEAAYASASNRAVVASSIQQQTANFAARKCKKYFDADTSIRNLLGVSCPSVQASAQEEPEITLTASPDTIDQAKQRCVEKLREAISRREKGVKQRETIRLEALHVENHEMLQLIGEITHLAKQRITRILRKTVEFVDVIASSEAEANNLLLRHMAISRTFKDLLQVQALPESVRGELVTLKRQQETAFQASVDKQLQQFRVLHSSTVLEFKRINDQYCDSVKRATYSHQEAYAMRKEQALIQLHQLHKEDLWERLHLKELAARSVSEAFLMEEAASIRESACQKQLNLLKTCHSQRRDPAEMKVRLAEICDDGDERFRRMRVLEGSRLAERLSALNELTLKEEALLERLLEQQRQAGGKLQAEILASDLHEAELQQTTICSASLLLQHAFHKATSTMALLIAGSDSIDADLADYTTRWEKAVAEIAAKTEEDTQKQKALHVDRLQSLAKSLEAKNAVMQKAQLQCAHELIELQLNQGTSANENKTVMQDALQQLAAYEADAMFVEQNAALSEQDRELKAIEDEIAKLDSLSLQLKQGPLGSSDAEKPRASRQRTQSSLIRLDSAMPGRSQSLRVEAKGDINQEGAECLMQTSNDNGSLADGQPIAAGSIGDPAVDAFSQLQREAAETSLEAAQAHLVQQALARTQQVELEAAYDRQNQNQKTKELLHQKRQRLLERKRLLESQQKEQLEELERQRLLALEKLQEQLQEEVIEFVIGFEVEPQELGRLARQVWDDSHHRHHKRLEELEQKHSKAMEAAYEAFLKQWGLSHNGDAEADKELRQANWISVSSRLEDEQLQEKLQTEQLWLDTLESQMKTLAAKGSEVAKNYLEHIKQETQRTARLWQKRYEALQKEQAEVLMTLKEKEAAYKESVEQRLRAAEAQCSKKIFETESEEWNKQQQVQQLAEARFQARRKMILQASSTGSDASGEDVANKSTAQEASLSEMLADVRELQMALQAEKARQLAAYRLRLIHRQQRKRRLILREAAEARRDLLKAAMDQQQQVLNHPLKQRFLFNLTKTRQVFWKISQQWLAAAREHLRTKKETEPDNEERLPELSEEEFLKRCTRLRKLLSKTMRQVEHMIRGLIPEEDHGGLLASTGKLLLFAGGAFVASAFSQVAQATCSLRPRDKKVWWAVM